jgi:hypothetical protein
MTLGQKLNLFFLGGVLLIIVLYIVVTVFLYKRNKSNLKVHANAIKIQPAKMRFVFSWVTYLICLVAPILLVLWIFPFSQARRMDLQSLVLLPLLMLLFVVAAYPYYTIITYEGKLNGPTLWGWLWRREEIAISEIDKERTLHRNIGRKLGILIFYSLDGKKILSLGLDDSQVDQILALVSEASLAK